MAKEVAVDETVDRHEKDPERFKDSMVHSIQRIQIFCIFYKWLCIFYVTCIYLTNEKSTMLDKTSLMGRNIRKYGKANIFSKSPGAKTN